MDLNAKEVMSAIKIMVALFFEIDSGGIYTIVASISHDIMVQIQIVMKIVVVESFVVGVIDIEWDDMYREIALMRQDMKDY